MFPEDFKTLIWTDVKAHIMKERNKWKDVYGFINDYIEERSDQFIMFGEMSLALLYDDGEIKSYQYEYYCYNALRVANDLVNKLSEAMKTNEYKYLFMLSTDIPYYKFTIRVNSRIVVSFYNLHESISINTHLMPTKYKNINMIPPELQLIDIYNGLYSINRIDDWPRLLKLKGEISKKTGGADINREAVNSFLKMYVYNSNEIIILGDYAANLLKHNNTKINHGYLEILTTKPIEFIYNKLCEYYSRSKLEFANANLNIFSDNRLKKYVIRNDKTIVMIIYNSPTYEIIPYFKHCGYNIANKYVLIRFSIIDIWVINVYYNMGKIGDEFRKISINRLTINKRIFDEIEDKKDHFLGTYIDIKLAMKIDKLDMAKFTIYYPQKYYLINQKYRDFK
jgi:hypothetical protein